MGEDSASGIQLMDTPSPSCCYIVWKYSSFISEKEERSIENHICSSMVGSESDKIIFDQSPLGRSRLEGEQMDLMVILTDPATVTT